MAKKTKEDPIFGLSKLPDKAFIKALQNRIKELNIEGGKNRSYIYELEDKLKEYTTLNKEELIHKNLRDELDIYKKLCKKQKKQIHNYLQEQKKLIHENLTLKQKLKDYGTE